MDEEGTVELDQLRLLRLAVRRWATILVCMLLGLGVGLLSAAAAPERYTATEQVAVTPAPTIDDLLSPGRPPQTLVRQQVATQIELLRGDRVSQVVAERIAGVTDSYEVDMQPVEDTDVVTISVTSPSPRAAAAVARAYGRAYLKVVEGNQQELTEAAGAELRSQLADIDEQLATLNDDDFIAGPNELSQESAMRQALLGRQGSLQQQLDRLAVLEASQPHGQARVVSAASVPNVPTGSAAPALAVGALAGLLVGLFAAYLQESIAGRVVDEMDVIAAGAILPVLGSTGARLPRRADESATQPLAEPELQDYRTLAATLWPPRGTPLAPVLYVATVKEDRAASTAFSARMRQALLGMGRSVRLLQVSPGHPTTVQEFDSDSDVPGISPKHAVTALDDIRLEANAVLAIGTGVVSSADALLIAPFCDGVVLLVRRGVTKRRDLRRAAERLERLSADVKFVGVVIQGVSGWRSRLHAHRGRTFRETAVDAIPAGSREQVALDQSTTLSRTK